MANRERTKKKEGAAFPESGADSQAAISVSGADCTDTKAAISDSGADCTDTKAAISVAGARAFEITGLVPKPNGVFVCENPSRTELTGCKSRPIGDMEALIRPGMYKTEVNYCRYSTPPEYVFSWKKTTLWSNIDLLRNGFFPEAPITHSQHQIVLVVMDYLHARCLEIIGR